MGPNVFPIPATSPLGNGKERAIAFGGGGEWFVCWTLGYCVTAMANGVDLENVDLTIGTSAGSITGAYVTAGTTGAAFTKLSQLAANPEVMAKMVVTDTGADSQRRATRALGAATATDVASIQAIGRAAMAAQNAPVADYVSSLSQLLGGVAWPSPKHHTTAVDCYTGELVIVSSDSGIDIATACAASSALPGVNGPVWLGDHFCMDGGISPSSTHSDALAGAGRIIVFSMMGRPPTSGSFGLTMRTNPNEIHDEVAYLESNGSSVKLVCADPADGIDFMDPTQLKDALALGAGRARADAGHLAAFWND
jgi:NTE family protein